MNIYTLVKCRITIYTNEKRAKRTNMETLNVAVTLLIDRRLTPLYLNIKHKQYVYDDIFVDIDTKCIISF